MQSGIRRLPLIVAVAGFTLYALTLGGGATASSLVTVARLAGWDKVPLVGQPLLWLVTLPLHLLPEAWLTLAVKGLAATLGALLLGLLARTLQLLPWDRSWDGASRWTMALPVFTGCALCGLEFSFWQNATAECGELLALLPLAAAGWLLLEFHVRQNRRWLDAAAVVWGVGMAENWVMILALPVFGAALIGLLRLQFFSWIFIRRLALLILAGFSVYAVLPLANSLAPHAPWTFGQAWLASLHHTKTAVLVPHTFWHARRLLTLVVAVYFFVPSLPLLVRLRDEGGASLLLVDQFQVWLHRGLRLILLLACLWLALDPRVGPRQMIEEQLNIWSPMLTLDYLNAIGAAFLLGNLLLIAQPNRNSNRFLSPPALRWKPWVVPAALILIVTVVAGMAARNARAIVRLNFHPVDRFGVLAANALPASGGVVLCDFPDPLLVFEAGLASSHKTAEWLPVDTRALPEVDYRAQLERLRPAGWLTDQNRHPLAPLEIVALLRQVARSNQLFYLHPSHGYFFEDFYLEPTGPVYAMKRRGSDPLDRPPMAEALVAANEQFWTQVWEQDLAALAAPPPRRPDFLQRQLRRFALSPVYHPQDRLNAAWFSAALDYWGVALQTQGRLPAARARFEQALRLNTNNVAARLNLICNTNLATTNLMRLDQLAKVAAELQKPDRLNTFINADGPFDAPDLLFLQGISLLGQGFLVQAAEQLERARTLASGSLAPELALAEIYNRLHMIDRSRPLINRLHEESARLPDNRALDLNLALVDSYAWLQQTNVDNAREVLQSLVQQHPDDRQINNRVLAAYIAFGDVTNALRLADAQLAREPDDINTLNNKAMILLHAGNTPDAIALLDRVLTLTNLATARLNRAYAGIANTNFTLAASDFRQLEKEGDASPMVSFGLATVAEHNHDTNQAVWYFKRCLSNTLASSSLAQRAEAGLRALQATPATK